MAAALPGTWNARTLQNNLALMKPAAPVFRRAVDRLHGVMSEAEAVAALRQEGSCMVLFWTLACWLREPRNQKDADTLLADLLSATPSRLATAVLRNALALLTICRQCSHPRADLA